MCNLLWLIYGYFSEIDPKGTLSKLQEPPELFKRNDVFLVYNQLTGHKYVTVLRRGGGRGISAADFILTVKID